MRRTALQAALFSLILLPSALRAQQQQPPTPEQPQPKKPDDAPPPKPAQQPAKAVSQPANNNPATGTWKVEAVPFAPWTFELKADGTKLTGAVSQGSSSAVRGRRTSLPGPVDIYDGTIDGFAISFKCKIPERGDRTITFTGKITGDEISFARQVQGSESSNRSEDGIFSASSFSHFTAKRDSVYDPYHAQHDIDVAVYYMHKGDTDAAIERLKDAIHLKPNFAKPRLLLGEIYEKKGDKAEAVRYYTEFLEILPEGPDSKRVRQRIEKLTKK
ncbi:MAG: tetratricopeptide repeat protein [Candidatus Acidiferrales bacterium]